MIRLLHGDCGELLKTLDTHSVDALVTDPPAGIDFMNLAFDSNRGGRREWVTWLTGIMREAWRVLKPGGHAVVWALPRTSHWTATAIEDAGFEIRDVLQHLFAVGFPKSHNISAALDRQAGAEREVVGVRRLPNGKEHGYNIGYGAEGFQSKAADCYISAPATPEAQQWAGWGSALKPSAEFWILARKPLSEPTLAANVLKWGTGGLNIDACRVPMQTSDRQAYIDKQKTFDGVAGRVTGRIPIMTSPHLLSDEYIERSSLGRFPAHTLHDGSAAVLAEFAKAGEQKPRQARFGNKGGNHGALGAFAGSSAEYEGYWPMDNGGTPARFFACCPPDDDDLADLPPFVYCPKASKRDRDEDCDGLQRKVSMLGNEKVATRERLDDVSMRFVTIKKNFHPTVKSTALMAWLIRLVTPPQGIVLDPFMGSGSTGKAAVLGGWAFIGIEQDANYFAIAERRVTGAHARAGQPEDRRVTIATHPRPMSSKAQISLFEQTNNFQKLPN